jgi:hypothetical protein
MILHDSTNLLLLATDQQVFAFDLKETSRITIGRHESSDVQLSSRTVSNYHAEIVVEGEGGLVLRDLGSTNGTYANGEKVDRVAVGAGDSILVGHHVLSLQIQSVSGSEDELIRYSRAPDTFGPGTRGRILSINARASEAVKTLQASDPNDMTFPDLLRQLAFGSRSMRAVMERQGEQGFVYARRGKIVHAECGAVEGEKALYRLFSWRQAGYEIEATDPARESVRTIHLPTDALISEGMEHSLEIAGLIARLPPVAVPLRLREDCPLPLTAHSPAEIDTFLAIVRHETIEKVLTSSPLPDVRVLRLVESLLRKGVFRAVILEPSHEETFVLRPKMAD